MTSNQLPAALLPYHLTSFPDYNGSAFGFGVMVIDDGEVSPSSPKGEVCALSLFFESGCALRMRDFLLLHLFRVVLAFDGLSLLIQSLTYPIFRCTHRRAGRAWRATAGGFLPSTRRRSWP